MWSTQHCSPFLESQKGEWIVPLKNKFILETTKHRSHHNTIIIRKDVEVFDGHKLHHSSASAITVVLDATIFNHTGSRPLWCTTMWCIALVFQPCDRSSSRNGTGVTFKEERPPAGATGNQTSFLGTSTAMILQQILLVPTTHTLSGFSRFILKFKNGFRETQVFGYAVWWQQQLSPSHVVTLPVWVVNGLGWWNTVCFKWIVSLTHLYKDRSVTWPPHLFMCWQDMQQSTNW